MGQTESTVMNAKKPRRKASKKTAARTAPSSKPKMGQKGPVALNQEQANRPENGHHEDGDAEISAYIKECKEDDHKALIRQTQKLIKRLKTGKVCLYPGPQNPPHDVGITEFVECLPFLGDCNMLIFCYPHHNKESAQAEIQHYTGGGDPSLLFNLDKCEGLKTDLILEDDLMSRTKQKELLVCRAAPNTEPKTTRPLDGRFWARYVILSIQGRNKKLHLLYLGLRGDHAWPYFLAPNGIHVDRIISNPDYR